MTERLESELPKDETIDPDRRGFVKLLITGAAGLAFTSAATSPALAKHHRKRQGQSQGHSRGPAQPSGKKRRHH